MHKTKEQERKELYILRAARIAGLSNVERYEDLSSAVKEHFASMEYRKMLQPLINEDRINGLAYRQIAIKYNIPLVSVYRRCKK